MSYSLTTTHILQILAAVYNVDVKELHIHNVQRNLADLKKLQDREEEKKAPLDRADVNELIPDFSWIHEPGIHLGFLSQEGEETVTIVLAVKIQ